MPKGGSRNRSGPQKQEHSGRSDKAGFTLTALPSEGYRGEAPEFPLSKVSLYDVYFVDKQRVKEFDADATQARWERELALWEWAWSTPQAAAWARESWRWHTVAMWVRTFVLCEAAEATAADKNSLHRFADQIGLTPAGLKENGWKVADDEVTERRPEVEPEVDDPRSRLTVVADGRGA